MERTVFYRISLSSFVFIGWWSSVSFQPTLPLSLLRLSARKLISIRMHTTLPHHWTPDCKKSRIVRARVRAYLSVLGHGNSGKRRISDAIPRWNSKTLWKRTIACLSLRRNKHGRIFRTFSFETRLRSPAYIHVSAPFERKNFARSRKT